LPSNGPVLFQVNLRDSSLNRHPNTHGDSVRCPGPAVLPSKSGGVAQKEVPDAPEPDFTYEHKRFTDKELDELLVVGNSIKVAYWHPMAEFTEIIKGTIMELNFRGAVRVKDSNGVSHFLARENIRSPKRRRIFAETPEEPVYELRESSRPWGGLSLDDFIRERVAATFDPELSV
jgi:hypothetical protein